MNERKNTVKTMKAKKLIPICLCFAAVLSSCARSDGGKQKLKDALFGDYQAEIHYSFSSEGEELSGEATITKGENTTVLFHTPDALSDVTAQSGGDGFADTITFEYYGMRIPLPQGALTKMNLLLSLFSGETAAEITDLPSSAFLPVSASDENTGELFSCTVPLSCGGSATLVADKNSGYPVSFSAEYENAKVYGEITNFTT